MKPDYAEAQYNLGKALALQGRVPEAIRHYEQVLRIRAYFPNAQKDLGIALVQQGDGPRAVEHLNQALRSNAGDVEARNQLAWVLATCADRSVRDGKRAVELAEGANGLAGGKNPGILDTLAAGYAETSRFKEAARTAQVAVELAREAGQAEQARQIGERLKLYQAGQPYHEAAPPKW
jgi:tetratricopeptide (TPR) repeat protein